MDVKAHWEGVYRDHAPEQVSWYERVPVASLDLVAEAGLASDAALLDVGGGASSLAGELVDAGHTDVSVADVSAAALEAARRRLGDRADRVEWIEADVRSHEFGRRYDLWHDRVVLHFMVERRDRDRYLDVLRRTLRPGGHLIVAAFGPDGPTRCSGLTVTRYGEDELARALGPEFEPVSARLAIHQTPSGGTQQFLYAHLRRVGQPSG